MRPPPRRAALDQQERLGHEDEHRRVPAQLLDGAHLDAVDARLLALTWGVGDGEGAAGVVIDAGRTGHRRLGAREPCAPAHRLVVLAGPRRGRAQRVPGSFEQVGLAAGIASHDDVEPRRELDGRVAVAAEVDEPQSADEHTRYSAAPRATTSPGPTLCPRRVSTAPFTRTSPSWMSSLASPPVWAAPASLRNAPNGRGPLTSTSISCSA